MRKRFLSLITLALASSAFAQPMVDRVPQDSLMYVGWAGADALAGKYEQSHLKAVADASRVQALFGPFLTQAQARVAKDNPQAAQPMRLARAFGAPLWKYPSVACLVDFGGDDEHADAKPRGFILCRAGNEAAALNKQLQTALPPAGDLLSFVDGDTVVLAFGFADPKTALGTSAKSLSQNAVFTSAMAKLRKDEALTLFINAQNVVAQMEAVQQRQNASPQRVEQFKRFLDASGLRGLQSYASTSGFDGKEWLSQSFASAPGPRKGLLALGGTTPASQEMLSRVPNDSTFFAAFQFDPAAVVNAVRQGSKEFGPEAADGVEKGLAAGKMFFGVDLVTDFLEPLGGEWAVYQSPSVGGNNVLGLVAVNKLDDPVKFKNASARVALGLGNLLTGLSRQQKLIFKSQVTRIDEHDISYFGVPIIAPAWAIKDDRLFVALYPQNVAAALRHDAKGKPSILESEKYQAAVKRLGVDKPASVTFSDLDTMARYGNGYATSLALLRYGGMADLFGVPLPEPLLPPLDVVLDHLSPGISATWSDADGFYSRSVTPFPGAGILAGDPASISAASPATIALGTSILLPSLNRARESANRVKSASNLRQIGLAMMLSANENQGRYPLSAGDLLDQDLSPQVFISPRTGTTLPPNAPLDQLKDWVETQSDYVYLGGGLTATTAGPERITAYERPDGLDDGINVLFGDGHVEFLTFDAARKTFAEQQIDEDFPGGQ